MTDSRLPAALIAVAALALPASAFAAALERAVPAVVRILHEDGTYGEVGVVYTDPDLSGRDGNAPRVPAIGFPGGPVSGDTGNLLRDDWKFSGALKGDVAAAGGLSWALLFDQPLVANTRYRQGSYPDAFNYGGTEADVDTHQFTGLLAYDATDRVKVFGGVRAQRLEADAAIPFLLDYSIEADAKWGYGYLVGAAYTRPEIGLRVAFTYASKISYTLDTAENSALTGPVDGRSRVDTPQSATFEAQTGVNPRTLLFGSVRWVDWSDFALAPEVYETITAAALGEARPLVEYPEDWWTYNIGVARAFTDTLAGSLSLTYEPQVDEVLATLGPVDGRTALNAGLSYDLAAVNIAGGLSYGWLGDTTNLLDTKFRDGTVFGAGLRLGYRF